MATKFAHNSSIALSWTGYSTPSQAITCSSGAIFNHAKMTSPSYDQIAVRVDVLGKNNRYTFWSTYAPLEHLIHRDGSPHPKASAEDIIFNRVRETLLARDDDGKLSDLEGMKAANALYEMSPIGCLLCRPRQPEDLHSLRITGEYFSLGCSWNTDSIECYIELGRFASAELLVDISHGDEYIPRIGHLRRWASMTTASGEVVNQLAKMAENLLNTTPENII